MLVLAGHLHPVLVHLPIGFILIALFLEVVSMSPARATWKPAADAALAMGVVFAALSCVTGYILSLSGDYDSTLVTAHQWLAISLTVLAGLLYVSLRGRRMGAVSVALSATVLLLVFVTGHLGGSLTHGSDYLSLQATDAGPSAPLLHPVADIQGAGVYTDLVMPVLHDNCYRCHSSGRQKGGLRLDNPEGITRGGKNGPAPAELLKRILLPLDDEHHMAPKEKPQLTASEVALLRWWVKAGAPFDKKVHDLPQDSAVKPVLVAFQAGTAGPVGGMTGGPVADSDMPRAAVAPASVAAIARLEAAGALVLPIATGSSYLDVRFPNDTMGASTLQALDALSPQLVSIKLTGLPAGDDFLPVLGHCKALVRLWLDHTHVTGKALGELRGLSQLRYLNLAGTTVTSGDLSALSALPQLHELFLYKTSVDKARWTQLQAAFPHTRLDSGGYTVPFLTTDTAIVRAPAH
jgi:uncharacterized membrane protein